ncbi:MAG: ribokinase [Phycisphaerae bacterium]|nr:ribokinase [Phycisphaerae bacterium]
MAEGKPSILVVGSVNMDLAVRCPHIPAPGETVLGKGLVISPGGKGANQAVAAARLGGKCVFVGRVGQDAFGEQLLAGLKAEGVDCSHVLVTDEAPTGMAMIVVDAKGENAIVVAGGANQCLTPDDVFSCEDLFAAASVVLLQLELPLPPVRAAIDLARRHHCKVILDPAPAQPALDEALLCVDIICPNGLEADTITGQGQANEERAAKSMASDLVARGAGAAVVTLGARGSVVVTADGHFYRVPAYKVSVVDTTAAGDAFAGALAVAVARGEHIRQAARFANAAGALACTKFGATSAMPTAAEVAALMRDQPT